jgi:sulfate adenylyltransferase large subunit
MTGELLRFTTAGSVDDGKSTLIGRLLYDSQAVYEDHLASARRATRNHAAGPLDLSLLTDGLRAEREQGITIDVAYRYFSTPKRKFIIADAPGHEQYTRNMATAASTADLAVMLIDARHGVLPQSRRHAYITALLGVPRVVVAVNKMDQVDFSSEVFSRIRDEFGQYIDRLALAFPAHFIPMSALDGDNVVRRSERTPWYGGPSLLEYLETVPTAGSRNLKDFRFPVQYVIRTGDFRGFSGQIASGVVRRGDRVIALPGGRESVVRSIVTWDGELEEAFAPMSVTVRLEDEVDISRGDMLVAAGGMPSVANTFEASLVWMSESPLRAGRAYLLKHTAQMVRARVREVVYRVDVGTLAPEPASGLGLNEIGRAIIQTGQPLFFDSYHANRALGSFVLIDPITNETAGGGMIECEAASIAGKGRVTAEEIAARNGHRALVIALDSTCAAPVLERMLFEKGCQAIWLNEQISVEVMKLLVLSHYNSGSICIISDNVPDLGSEVSVFRFEASNSDDPNVLADRVWRLVSL